MATRENSIAIPFSLHLPMLLCIPLADSGVFENISFKWLTLFALETRGRKNLLPHSSFKKGILYYYVCQFASSLHAPLRAF